MTEYARIGKRGTVVIPAELRRELGLGEGDLLAMESSAGGLTVTLVQPYETEVYTPSRIAEFLLNNAIDGSEYDAAVAEVREMGIDPDSVPHQLRPEP